MNQQTPPSQQPAKKDYYHNENTVPNSTFLRVFLDASLLFFGTIAMYIGYLPPLNQWFSWIGAITTIFAFVRIFQNRNKATHSGFRGEIRKIDDFFIGVGLMVLGSIIILPLLILPFLSFLPFLAFIAAIVIAARQGRSYMMIGMLSVSILPFLLFGACLGVITMIQLKSTM